MFNTIVILWGNFFQSGNKNIQHFKKSFSLALRATLFFQDIACLSEDS